MWILGVVVGLLVGSWFGTFSSAIVLGIVGGIFAHVVFDKKKTANPAPAQMPAQNGSIQNTPATNTQPQSVLHLIERVATLERRLQQLEQARSLGSATFFQSPSPLPSAASPAALQSTTPAGTSAPIYKAVPAATVPLHTASEAVTRMATSEKGTAIKLDAQLGPALAPLGTLSATSATSATAAPASLLQSAVPAVAAIAESVTAPAVAKPPIKIQPPPPAPPPPPAVPMRDRLPAPLAKLLFGGNMLVKMGVLILFLGLAFLLRYTAERVTVPLELRYAAVALVGMGLLAIGWLLRNKRASYALVLQGAGIGVFYLTVLSAMRVHTLLPTTAGFVFLFGVAALSAALAVLQNAPVLAIVAALEGFAAPVLASSGQNQPVGLFTYLLVLDTGIVLIAWFKAWRILNLIGFVGTFTLAAGWADKHYTDPQFAIAQPFLLVFFVLFVAIGLLFARRTLADGRLASSAPPDESLAQRALSTFKRVGRVDSSLVFGTPMVAFGLQYMLMRPWEYGAAFSAMGLAAFYLLLARVVFSTQPKGLALLAEAYAIVGVIFGTLAIPLALEGQWTGAAWAVEAAGMYWLGARQARPYARAFSLLVFAGAVFKLLQATNFNPAPASPLLQGTVIGPLLVAAGAFVMWDVYRSLHASPTQRQAGHSDKLNRGYTWELLACAALPWLGMAALTLLLWQVLLPVWAAAATALLASLTFAIAARFALPPLTTVTYGMQALAVAGFVTTLHRGDSTGAALGNGWQGALAASLIALSLLSSVAWTMLQVHRAALVRGVQPAWSLGNTVAVLTGVSLLHVAMLFQIDLQQAAMLWPLTALVALWVSLRFAHPALSAWSALLHAIAAALYIVETGPGGSGNSTATSFAHLGFWTPVVLGLTALLAGDWVRSEALPASAVAKSTRWANTWCTKPVVLWLPVLVGLGWWLFAMSNEVTRVLHQSEAFAAFDVAACIAIVLVTSVLASIIAHRRVWSQMGLSTVGTLPALGLVALAGIANAGHAHAYVPSVALGWLAWPLAALWHLRLLKAQTRWAKPPLLSGLHVAGFWFFLLLATRECQFQMGRLGDDWSTWQLLGWALAPATALWALQSRLLARRWPVVQYARAYVEIAALPVAAFLMLWAWVSNVASPGNAAPLPYVPLLNPLELAHWTVLLAVLLWWRALPKNALVALPAIAAKGVAGITAFAFLTGMVLRTCHHYADVPWTADGLYSSRLTQAALSLTWAACGVLTMVLGHRRLMRPVWVVGAALLGVVVLKLFFVELADRGGLFRIVSFIGVGALLLLVGYFAPVPPVAVEKLPDLTPGPQPKGPGTAAMATTTTPVDITILTPSTSTGSV